MAKYIDADLLRAEIKERTLFYAGQANLLADTTTLDGFDEVLSIIDSLQQEQPEVDLEKEIKEWVDLIVGASFPEQDGDFISEEDYRSVIRQTAIHFLGLNARMKEAAQHVYESWMGGTMDDVRRDMVELGRVINARQRHEKDNVQR